MFSHCRVLPNTDIHEHMILLGHIYQLKGIYKILLDSTLVFLPCSTSLYCKSLLSLNDFLKNFIYWFLERVKVGGGGETLICCSTYLCIHWLLLEMPSLDIKLATLVYRDNALTNWSTQPGLINNFWLKIRWKLLNSTVERALK